jgi:hypothetical protein
MKMNFIELFSCAGIEVMLVKVFYWPGWLFCRAVTLGFYPPRRDQPHAEDFVALLGLLVFLLPLIFWAMH